MPARASILRGFLFSVKTTKSKQKKKKTDENCPDVFSKIVAAALVGAVLVDDVKAFACAHCVRAHSARLPDQVLTQHSNNLKCIDSTPLTK